MSHTFSPIHNVSRLVYVAGVRKAKAYESRSRDGERDGVRGRSLEERSPRGNSRKSRRSSRISRYKWEYGIGNKIDSAAGIVIRIGALSKLEAGPRFELTAGSIDERNTCHLHASEAAGEKLVWNKDSVYSTRFDTSECVIDVRNCYD
ncbi:hypothetical protein EVAR_59117_1 [Eumeta japonica]|uniref:Uncharacterized protein n=1 Tax=Eumeta variegata TaxID=151549 RepID=A0A4C1ZEJ1_EUMVA|nr:hypothetical protein EVAR_59117_1 [Eumeta japonica]